MNVDGVAVRDKGPAENPKGPFLQDTSKILPRYFQDTSKILPRYFNDGSTS
jgi:hypothetical protein